MSFHVHTSKNTVTNCVELITINVGGSEDTDITFERFSNGQINVMVMNKVSGNSITLTSEETRVFVEAIRAMGLKET